MTVVLIYGSFPPVLDDTAAATVAAARREWASGRRVVTVAPRASAAEGVEAVVGPLAGWRLDRLRRRTSASRLVMAIGPDVPIPERGSGAPPPPRGVLRAAAERELTIVGLRLAFRRFDYVTLLVAGGSKATLSRLAVAAGDIVGGDSPAGDEHLASVAGRIGSTPLRFQPVTPLSPHPPAGVTALGPPEAPQAAQPQWRRAVARAKKMFLAALLLVARSLVSRARRVL